MALIESPITFKEFIKHPGAALLFLCLFAISGLYVRSENKNSEQYKERLSEIKELKIETKQLITEVSFLKEQVRRSDSALADVRATLKVLKEYGKITQ